MDVILVGPMAPPRGGVSAHVGRLASLLEKEGLRVGILDHFNHARDPRIIASLSRNPVRYWLQLRRVRAHVVHYHHARLSTLVAAALARRRCHGTWIVTFHSHVIERSLTSKMPGVAAMSRWAVSRFDQVIAVSDSLAEVVRVRAACQVTVIPAYLPHPARDENARDSGPVTPTAIVAAYRVASRASEDLYGLDIASAIFIAASTQMADLRFEMFLSQAPGSLGARRYLTQVLRQLSAAGLEERFEVNIGSELSSAFRRGAVYLRTTRTDGDAVSIREALDAGIPVLASDVAERPAGAVQLPFDDVSAWVTALSAAVERSQSQPITVRNSAEPAEALMRLYHAEVSRCSQTGAVAPDYGELKTTTVSPSRDSPNV